MATSEFQYPPKPTQGDTVAVVSPSGRAAGRFPRTFELGLRRLRDEFGVVPVEYPTTRAAEATPAERAQDIHAAFGDTNVRAVIASIGGDDELKVLRHLDPDILKNNPKPFFGYSDNTNLHLFLWNIGIVSYHGGAVMVQLARPSEMNPATRESFHNAMFTHGTYRLNAPDEYTDEEADWNDPNSVTAEPEAQPAEPWSWHGPERKVEGTAWGGSLEIVDFHLRTNRYLQDEQSYKGAILFLETSEEMPSADYVYRVLVGMGERGLLSQFGALMWARPKAWSHQQPNVQAEKSLYIEGQKDAVLKAVGEYNPGIPIVFGVDFGHTDPQLVIPSGGQVTLDAVNRTIDVTY